MRWVVKIGWYIWLATRPKCVRRLAAEFPLGSEFDTGGGKIMHLIGYTENDTLIVSPIDPSGDVDAAMECREYLCAEHFRETTP